MPPPRREAGLKPPRPPLADGEILLRPACADDLSALARACADPDLAAWVHPPARSAGESATRLLARLEEGWSWERTASFLAFHRDTDGLLALASVMRERDPDAAELAYWVAPETRRRGIGTCVVRLVSTWALGDLGLARLWLEIEPGNTPSHRLAERAGFTREALLRAHCEDRRTGRRHDCVVYSRLPSDP